MTEIDPYAVADQLDRVGDRWRDRLPAGAEVEAVNDPLVYDTVRLVDGTRLYRRPGVDSATGYDEWVVLGWSDAARLRRFRRTSLDHSDTLHEGD